MTTAVDVRLREMERAAASESGLRAVALLTDVRAWTRRFVVVGKHETLAIALWVMLTHALKITDCVPYLAINSPEKASGKTRCLECLEPIVARPWLTGRTTPAVLARKIDKEHPTLLLDESDATFRGDKEYGETLRGVLNTGYLRSGKTSLCVAKGKSIEYVDLSTFCPKAIAGIGELPDTVADRSIPIRLQRKLASEPVERFRRKRVEPEARKLRGRLETWAATFVEKEHPEPAGLDDLPDRAADIWEPLLVIAEACGEEVAREARDAATALCGNAREDQSLGVRTLRDIKALFDDPKNRRDRIPSAEMVNRLREVEDVAYGPRFGRDFDARALAERLRPFSIKSKTIRLDDDRTPKGYYREQFEEAWARYLASSPSGSPQQAQQAPQGRQIEEKAATNPPPQAPQAQHGSGESGVVAANGPQQADEAQRGNPHEIRDVADVALVAPPAEGPDEVEVAEVEL